MNTTWLKSGAQEEEGRTKNDLKLTSSSMETLLFGSASALRLMLTVASVAAAQSIKSFFVEWYFPQVRLKLQWKSWRRLNLGREDVPRWGRADEDAEVSVDIFEEVVLRERIIHKREEKERKETQTR